MKSSVRLAVVCLAACVPAAALGVRTPAYAAQVAGEVVALDGTAQVQRGSDTLAAAAGFQIQVGDRVRTAKPGRVRLLFVDGSTIVLTDASELMIDEHVFDPSAGKVRTLLRLMEGRLRAIVSEYYGDSSARYEVHTAGAVAGVRGTEFFVDYDATHAGTEVATLSGEVAVRGVEKGADASVVVTPDHVTTVKRGVAPGRPRPLSASERSRFLESFRLSGLGELGATLEQDAVMQGEEVPEAESPAASGPGVGAGTPERVGQDPGGAATTPSDTAGQPIPALEGPGRVGVPF